MHNSININVFRPLYLKKFIRELKEAKYLNKQFMSGYITSRFAKRLGAARPTVSAGAITNRAAAIQKIKRVAGRIAQIQRARGIPASMPFRAMRSRPEELKYLDIARASYLFETDATRAVLINGVATGSTSITREGNQVYWKAIQIRGMINHLVAAGADVSRADLYVVYDDQPGAAVPTNAEILSASTTEAFINLDYRERFKILHHSSYVFGPSDTTATQTYSVFPQVHAVDVYVKCNVRTSFKGTGNAIGDISKGAIYIFTMGNTTNASGDYSAGAFAIRLRFSER